MSVKYEILKRIVKAAGLKKMWEGKSAADIVAAKKKANAKNRIPDLKDPEFNIDRIKVMGFTVIRMKHKAKGNRSGCVRALLSALYRLSPYRSICNDP